MASELDAAKPQQQQQKKKKDGNKAKLQSPCGLQHYWVTCWLVNCWLFNVNMYGRRLRKKLVD
jgi:hypothetical protein